MAPRKPPRITFIAVSLAAAGVVAAGAAWAGIAAGRAPAPELPVPTHQRVAALVAFGRDLTAVKVRVDAAAQALASATEELHAADRALCTQVVAAAQGDLDASGHADQALRDALASSIGALQGAVDDHVAFRTALPQVEPARRAVVESQAVWQAAEDARLAAEKAAAARAARSARGVASSVAAGPDVVWSTHVVNAGGQGAVDACAGGLTLWHRQIDGKAYYPIHRGCGGAAILTLRTGDIIAIDGARWVVSDVRVVPKGAKEGDLYGMSGEAILQTCYPASANMRAVAITRR